MSNPKILALTGSARKDSHNGKLVRVAAEGARRAGAEVTLLDVREYALPIFDEDLEAEHGSPANASELRSIFRAHQGLLIACPEYNSSITPLLKNLIDWVSRTEGDHPALACYAGKFACLMSASPGGLGGLRGLVHVRAILGNLGVTVLPDQVAVPKAHEAFAVDGSLVDAKVQSQVEGLGVKLAKLLARLH